MVPAAEKSVLELSYRLINRPNAATPGRPKLAELRPLRRAQIDAKRAVGSLEQTGIALATG